MANLSLVLAVVLVIGLAGGVSIDTPLTFPVSIALAAGWLIATIGFLRSRALVQMAGIVISLMAAGWLLGAHALERALHPPLRTMLEQRVARDWNRAAEEPILIEGRLVEDAAPTEIGAVLRLQIERIWLGPCPESAAGGVSVGVGGAMHDSYLTQWTAGRIIRAPALLRKPAIYLNEGLADQERALARRGITLVGTIKSASLVEVVGRGRWWEEIAARVRARTRLALARHVHARGSQSGAIATAILIGDRAGLEIETEQRLQEAGTYHVIAISGGNIAILAGLVLASLSWLGVRGRLAALTTIAVLSAYAIVAAGGASVARATLMAAVYLAVRLIDQRTAATNAIGLTGGALLLINPLNVIDVGFWLTFLATAAIVVGASMPVPPKLAGMLPSEGGPVPPKLAGMLPSEGLGAAFRTIGRITVAVLIATVCAELALIPVSATVFQRITFAGLLLNFAALPAMTVVQIGAMAVVLLDLVGLTTLAHWAGAAVHAGAVVLVDSARLLDYSPWLTWRVPSPSAVVVAAYYAALAVAVWRRSRFSIVLTAALFLWIVVAPPARVRAMGHGRLELTLFDVGQGDAMLVTFPNGRTLMVDSGGVSLRGDFDIGDRVIGPSLRASNLLHLDYLAVTHGDPDHIGGARALVRDFRPKEIWWGVPVANHEPAAILQQQANRARAGWRTLQRGDRLGIGGVELRVHHPPPPDWERQKVRNNDSLVFELRFGQVSMLLTGDIGREVEAELLPTLDLLPTVILKVPHHGSGTSSSVDFVEHLRPAIALIGAGRGNAYGHPVPYVLERYHRTNTRVYRTDIDGQVTVSSDGQTVTVTTYTARRAKR